MSIQIITCFHPSSRSFSPPPSTAAGHAAQGLPTRWAVDFPAGLRWKQPKPPILSVHLAN
jgi:hypothetical protein